MNKKLMMGLGALALCGVCALVARPGDKGAKDTAKPAAQATAADSSAPAAGDAATVAPEPAEAADIGSKENPAGMQTPVGDNDGTAWVIGAVEDKGQTIDSGNQFITSPTTSGKFIHLAATIRNLGKDSASITAPKLIDSAGREFDASSEVAMIIKADRHCLFETLNPGLDKTCEWVYDVPTDATGLMLEVHPGGMFSSAQYLAVNP